MSWRDEKRSGPRIGWALAILALGPLLATGQEKPAGSAEASAEERAALNMESFELVWKTVRERHWDPKLGGVDWDAARNELRPQLEAATSTPEARDVMRKLLARLGKSHYGIIPASSYSLFSEGQPKQIGEAGLTLRLVDEQVVVTHVRADSGAAAAGVKPGWAVHHAKGKDAADLIKQAKEAAEGPLRFESIVGIASPRLFQAEAGEEVEATFLDEQDQPQAVKIKLGAPVGEVAKFGHLPPMRVEFEHKRLDSNIEYIRFNLFFNPVQLMPAYLSAIEDARQAEGLVIDLRGNVGGIGAMTMGMASPFVREPVSLGTMIMRGAELKFAVNIKPRAFNKPLALLVDECSISSAEIFAGGLKDLGLARVFGQRTAGLALPSTVIKLPNGDGFQFAVANYVSAAGQELEENGVLPDEVVLLRRADLLEGHDPALERAVQWIREPVRP